MTLKASTLEQSIFDNLVEVMARLWLISDDEMERIATALENPTLSSDELDHRAGRAFAAAVRMYKDGGQ